MKTNGKLRALSLLLTLIMVFGMLPTTVFAASYSPSNPLPEGASYQEGDSVTGPKPADIDGMKWVQSTETTEVLTCSGHTHTDDCYAKTCGHEFGHTDSCYTGGESGKWVVCEKKSSSFFGEKGNCEHYFDVPGYDIHYGMDAKTFVEAMNLNISEKVIQWIHGKLDKIGAKTCADCANKLALELILRRWDNQLPQNYSWVNDALAALKNETIADYVHYEHGKGAELTCNHVCTDACKTLVCDGHHTDECYTEYYTWTLAVNDDCVVTFDSNGGSKVDPQTVEKNGKVSAPDAPTKENHAFVGWFDKDGKQWKFETMTVTEDMTLTAHWVPDQNGNGVDDEKETITVNITGAGSVTVNGTTLTESGTVVYASQADAAVSVTVTAKPADGCYLGSITVDGNACGESFQATGCHTINAVFYSMTIVAQDGEMAQYGITSKKSAELVSAIQTATKMTTTPDTIRTGVKTEYLAADWGTYGELELKYWAVPGDNVDVTAFVDNLIDDNAPFAEGTKAAIKSFIEKIGAPHNFGKNKADANGVVTEQVRHYYQDGTKTVYSNVVTLTLVDNRIATSIEISDQPAEVTYGQFTMADVMTALSPYVSAKQSAVTSAKVEFKTGTDITKNNAGTYEVTLVYGGNETYKPCEKTVEVTIAKADATVSVANQTVKYGSTVASDVITTKPSGVKHIDFLVGLDVHDETNLAAVAQVVLPLDSSIAETLEKLGFNLSGEMSIGDLSLVLGKLVQIMGGLDQVPGLEAALGDFGLDTETIETLIKALEAAAELGGKYGVDMKVQVSFGTLTMPKNVGVYLIGSVTADRNYNTALGAGYLVITPNGVRVDLDWKQKDDNGIVTLPKAGDFDLTAFGTVRKETLEGASERELDGTADSHIRYLLLSVTDNKLTLKDTLPAVGELNSGAYLEVAYLTNWDNVMYYAEPIARTLLVVPALAQVTLEGKNEVTYDGKSHGLTAKVNGSTTYEGEMTVTYVGVDGHVKNYNSTQAPTEAGVYAVTAVYVNKQNGQVVAAGCAVETLVIHKAAPDFQLKDTTFTCDGKEHVAAFEKNSNWNNGTLDYLSVAVDAKRSVVYVNLPADWDEHMQKLPQTAQDSINTILSSIDGMNCKDAAEKLLQVIDALEAADKSDEVTEILKSLLAKVEQINGETLQAELKTQLEALEAALNNQVPTEIKELLKKLSEAANALDAEALKEQILTKIDALNVPSEVKAQLKTMVSDLARKVADCEDLTNLVQKIETILKNYQLPDADEIAAALAKAITGCVDQETLKSALEAAIAKMEGCQQIKTELEKLKEILSKVDGTVVLGHNPKACGTYTCYAVNISANFKSVLTQATLVIDHNIKTVVTEPTCTEGGYTTDTCKCAEGCDCNYKKVYNQTSALGHDWGDWTEDVEHGNHKRVCKRDADHVETEPHAWGDWTVTVPADYGKEGTETRTCSVCHAVQNKTIPALKRPDNSKPVDSGTAISVKGLDTTNHVAYIVGRDNGLVDPYGTITRAESATIFFRLMTENFRSLYWCDKSSFSDVTADAWYNVAVATLEKAGIIQDTVTGGKFRPNEPITRAELAVMAAQFCTISGKISASTFLDVPAQHWAAEEIALVQYAGWIEGFEGFFRPDDNLSRAECVTIVNRMLHRGAEADQMLPDMVTFRDNKVGAWYYEAIQEAANSHTYKRTGKKLTGETFYGESWLTIQKAPDWAALEQSWAKKNQN